MSMLPTLCVCKIVSPLMAEPETSSKQALREWDPSDGLSVAVHSKCIISDSHSPVYILAFCVYNSVSPDG